MTAGLSQDEAPYLERLLLDMECDGIPMSPAAVRRAVDQPDWATAVSAHDWRTYVPPAVRLEWAMLPLSARLCVFETAELVALDEAVGAAMVTGPKGLERVR